TFQPVLFWFADLISLVIQDHLSIVALDREHLGENRLEAQVLPFGRRHVRLKEFPIRIDLDFDQIGRRNDCLDFPEVDTFCCSRWHFYLWLLAGIRPDRYFFHKRHDTGAPEWLQELPAKKLCWHPFFPAVRRSPRGFLR